MNHNHLKTKNMNPTNQTLSRSLANSLYQGAEDGIELNHLHEPPKWGYLVCIKEGPTFHGLSSVDTILVGKFIETNIGSIPHPLHFFRATMNGLGGVYFDLYEQCANLDYARELAIREHQTEVMDIVNKKVLIVQK